MVLKTPRGGYDGKGVRLVEQPGDADDWLAGAAADAPLLAEERVAFDRELAVLVARSPHGQAAVWPVVETVQVDGVCREVVAPAPIHEDHALAAQQAALRIAEGLGVTGVMAVEMFDTEAGVLVNELAMRPHNSGHWTIEGSRTSQFEQHLRAVLDLPLGDTRMTAPHVRDGQRPRRRLPRHVRRLPALPRARPGHPDPHVRQAGTPRAKGGSRHGSRQRC